MKGPANSSLDGGLNRQREHGLDDVARVCAFCGEASDSLTREHVWPKWLQAELGDALEPHVQTVEDEPQRIWYAKPASLTVKRLCRACNNGWMARCEEHAAPVLRPLLRGAAVMLTPADQAVLARWAVKTAVACDLATGDPAAPAQLRRELATRVEIPSNLVVLVARYGGTRHPLMAGGWVRSHDVEVGAKRTSLRFLQLTVSAGSVVFQVVGHQLPSVVDFRPVGRKEDFAKVIWPVRGPLHWPLPVALGDDGLREFARVQ
jgi:hypothetical protein